MVSAADHTLPAKIPPGNASGGSRKLMGPLRHILVTFVWFSQSLRWDLWVGWGMSGSTTPPPHHRHWVRMAPGDIMLGKEQRNTLEI